MQILVEFLTAILTTIGGLLIFYAYFLPLILIHELGHLAAGRACGLRLVRFRVGLVELARPNALELHAPLRMHFSWKLWRLASGRIAMVSDQTSLQDNNRSLWIYPLGGPLSNLGCALLALPLALQDSMAGGIAKYFAVASFLLGAINLFPFRRAGIESDGMQLWEVVFDRKRRETQLHRLTLAARLNEITQLSENGQLKIALDRAEELISDDARLSQTSGSQELRRFLTTHRDRLRMALKSAGASKEVESQLSQPVEQDAASPFVDG